jgi:two-component system, cell cycle response regulator
MTPEDTLHVLAIDDSLTDLRLLERSLQRMKGVDARMTGVTSMEEAVARLSKEEASFHLIFVDYRLGADSGVEVIQALRERGIKLPMIMLTGQGDQRVAAESLRVGASDYVMKEDIGTPVFRESIDHALEVYQRERRQSHALRKAMLDGLTGLISKDYLMQRLNEEFERSRRYGIPLSCVMIDLDRFKKLNDTYGHLAGDETLRRVSKCVRGNLRGADIGGRFGGEEICLLLPETALAGAVILAERVRQEFCSLEIDHRDEIIKVTASFGVAELTEDMGVPDDLIQAADTALYVAKQSGRNRVCAADAEGKSVPTNSHC